MDSLLSLARLKELTDKIPAYNPYFFDESRQMQLECVTGSAYTVGVYKDKNVAIAKTTFSERSTLAKHCHPEKEVIFVLEGELSVVLIENRKARTVVLKQYDSLEIPPYVRHLCANVIKTVIIASTMPCSKYFPDPT